MEISKTRHTWILVLAGAFLATVAGTTYCLYALWPPPESAAVGTFPAMVYGGLFFTLVTGCLALWVTYHARLEGMVDRERLRDSPSLSGHPLTLSPTDIRGEHRPASLPLNGTEVPETTAEVVTIYGEDKRIRYISPAAEAILGYKQIDMIGKSDLDRIHPDHRASFDHIFLRLKENPAEQVRVQYAYKTREDNYIWLESTGSNCVADPAIHGYLLRSHDITARRLEEQAQRMRTKIQALSENSPDLIIRLENDTITYINPVVEFYTGLPAVAFLNKRLHETALDPTIVASWENIVEELSQAGGKIIMEMDFPSRVGKRIMQVHAIPEYDEDGQLESVLVVSHDITERKKIELEIQYQNRKITESIRYAKRIQGAILPNSRLINRVLPDSFILYKPRDVVSGDFPWFTQVKSDTFMAAVDCTGHGVPGALLSLVGYFLLNDIVRSRRVTDAGKILDLLDEGVSTTLRPDEDAGTKDGMDISLCRINMEKREVQYAGAHRPLYVVRNGILAEIKGDKFPIGGGIFKNQTNFTSTTFQVNTGDSIFFCSDGFCDQFGGPQGRKFGTRQLKDIIGRIHALPMKEAMQVFDEQWSSWKGEQKQTDDVLLIGVKFV